MSADSRAISRIVRAIFARVRGRPARQRGQRCRQLCLGGENGCDCLEHGIDPLCGPGSSRRLVEAEVCSIEDWRFEPSPASEQECRSRALFGGVDRSTRPDHPNILTETSARDAQCIPQP
jgi:hypothetical protein